MCESGNNSSRKISHLDFFLKSELEKTWDVHGQQRHQKEPSKS